MEVAFYRGLTNSKKGAVIWSGSCELICSALNGGSARVPAALVAVAQRLLDTDHAEYVAVIWPTDSKQRWTTISGIEARLRGAGAPSVSVREFDAPSEMAERIDSALRKEFRQ